jgi:hypothetical protein
MATLIQALESMYETASIETEESTIVISPDEDGDGYWISFQKGAMPPYSTEHATLDGAKQIIAKSAYASVLDSDKWEPIGEDSGEEEGEDE